ncbi:MAG: hypothetical protein WDN72_11190 [Alphaproteobacteria bacterium]
MADNYTKAKDPELRAIQEKIGADAREHIAGNVAPARSDRLRWVRHRPRGSGRSTRRWPKT